jgi:hypothetical protein
MATIRDPWAEQGGYAPQIEQSISGPIQQMIQQKAKEMQLAKQQSVFKNLGLNPSIAGLNPQAQNAFIKQHIENNPEAGAFNADPLSQIFSQLSPQNQQKFSKETGYNPMQQQQGMQGQMGMPGQQMGAQGQEMGIHGLQEAMAQHPALKNIGRKLSLRQQAQANATNKPFIAAKEKAQGYLEAARTAAQNLLQLESEGGLPTGPTARGLLLPDILQNDKVQAYKKFTADLINNTSNYNGQATNFKSKLIQAAKPDPFQPPKVRKKILDTIINELDHGLAKTSLTDDIIMMNGGQQPANLSSIVNTLFKDYEKQSGQKQKAGAPSQQQPQEADEESPLGAGIRHIVRSGARALGGALGTPGDLAATGLGLTSYLTGGKTPTYEQLQEKTKLLKAIPTSQQIADKIGEMSKGYTNPQGDWEQTADDVMSTFGSIFGAGGAIGKVTNRLLQSGKVATGSRTAKFLLPFSGEVAWKDALKTSMGLTGTKEVIKGAGGGPIAQGLGQLAFVMAANGRGTRKNLEKTAEGLFNKVDTPEGLGNVVVDAEPMQKYLKVVEYNRARSAAANQKEYDVIANEIKDALGGGITTNKGGNYMSVANLDKMVKNLNHRFAWTAKERIPGQREYLPAGLREPLRDFREQAMNLVEKGAKEAGKEKYFADLVRANDIWKGLNSTSRARKWIEANQNSLYGHETGKGPISSIWKLFASGGLKTAHDVTAFKQLFQRSPEARKLYMKVWEAAAAQNAGAFNQTLARLDKIYKES